MSLLSTVDQLAVLLATRAQRFEFQRTVVSTFAGTQHFSSWLGTGIPGPGVAPGAAAVPTSATAGALVKFTDPGGGEAAHLYSIYGSQSVAPAQVSIWDRLVHSGGLDSTVITLNTINTPAITRGDTTGVGVIGFLECYVQLGGTGATATIIYTNSAGVGSRTTTVAIPTTMRLGRLLPILPLQTGDIGIKSIESVQLSASTTVAGNYGVVLARRICVIPIRNVNQAISRVGLELGLPKIEAGACLWATVFTTTGVSSFPLYGGCTLFTTG